MNIKFNILILAFCLGIHVNAQEQLSFDAALQPRLIFEAKASADLCQGSASP